MLKSTRKRRDDRPKLGPGSDRDGSAEETVVVEEKTPKERWAALLEAIDRNIPADLTAEEIARDIDEAIEEVRAEHRVRRP